MLCAHHRSGGLLAVGGPSAPDGRHANVHWVAIIGVVGFCLWMLALMMLVMM